MSAPPAKFLPDLPAFLPPAVVHLAAELQEPEAIALLSALQRREIPVRFPGETVARAIATSFVDSGPSNAADRPSSLQGGDSDLPPILLLHGFDSSVLEYRRLGPRLAAGRRVWALDLLGFGFGDRPLDLDFSQAALRAHLAAFWQQAIGRPVVLVGASMGGAAAMDFALAHPEAVERLVLLDSAGFVDKPLASRFLIQPLGRLATAFLANPTVRDRIGRKAYADPDRFATPEAYRCGALHLAMPGWAEALISFTRNGGCTISGDRIAQLSLPTLVLWGEGDRILGTALADRFAKTLPQARLVWVANCGHVPHLEQAAFTAEQILDFAA